MQLIDVLVSEYVILAFYFFNKLCKEIVISILFYKKKVELSVFSQTPFLAHDQCLLGKTILS